MDLRLVKKHFFNPKNIGDIEPANATGKAGSLACGATLRVTLEIDEAHIIQEAKFKAAGCSFLVATASVLTEQVKNKTTGEAAALARNASNLVSREFGCLPADKEHCPVLACEALVAAIQQYSDSVREEWDGEEALICTCFGVSERTIEQVIKAAGLVTIAEVTNACNAGAGCRSCYSLIEDILEEVRSDK